MTRATVEQFIEWFPHAPFELKRVERGAADQRKFGWLARFTSDYYTSDSDRLVDDHRRPSYEESFAYSIEEALGGLALALAKNAEAETRHARERLAKLEAAERKLKEQMPK